MIHRLYYADCDICGAHCIESLERTVRAARDAAKQAGWRRRNDKYQCPNCQTTAQPEPAGAATMNPGPLAAAVN